MQTPLTKAYPLHVRLSSATATVHVLVCALNIFLNTNLYMEEHALGLCAIHLLPSLADMTGRTVDKKVS